MSDLPDRICIWEADQSDPTSTRGWTASFPESHPDIYVRASWNPRPAAPIDGLESYEYGFPSMIKVSRGGDWCHRPQAEAIIAAERAENERLQKINAMIMGDDENAPRYTTKRLKQEVERVTQVMRGEAADREARVKTIEADNAALTARVRRMETALRSIAGDTYDDSAEKVARAALEAKP